MENRDSSTQEPVSVLEGDGFYFDRILSRKSSPGHSSRIDYGRAEGVPFEWEKQPGTPKNPPEEEVIPPISPPPAVQSLALPKPSVNQPKGSTKSRTQFQLATLKKGSETISDYFHNTTTLSSTLSAAGHPLSHSEFNIYLFVGLGSDYESIVTSITTRPETLSSAQVFSYLLNHESRLAHQIHSLLSASLISTNSTVTQPTPPSSPWSWKERPWSRLWSSHSSLQFLCS
ncbi:hypothetical protein F0562_030601 [Nyssa sinensis]|uniref:Uncharacterized protein n=1 Tax=Nyssa sinensis TaxID=561372 RepID=A0A5J5AZ99_9ASTE|nr:hypothetical protein F0562_030601 [Nyssa sinensis]